MVKVTGLSTSAWLHPSKKLNERLGNTKGLALAEVQTGSFASLNFDFHNIEWAVNHIS